MSKCNCGRLARIVSCPPCEWCTQRYQHMGTGLDWYLTLLFWPFFAALYTFIPSWRVGDE